MNRIIFPLDVSDIAEAEYFIDTLKSHVGIFKIGLELFYKAGPKWVKNIVHKKNIKVFLDVKLHDIPNTVANAVASAVGLSAGSTDDGGSIFMLTVHISGGEAMLISAVESAAKHAERLKVMRPFIVGITVLTSQDKVTNIDQIVLDKAMVARRCGLDGVVASLLKPR